jgi:hypothetical protein
MTEEQWLACTEPQKMLQYLNGRAGYRKLRLFVCACARRVWHLIAEDTHRRAVEVGERIADDPGDHLEWAEMAAAISGAPPPLDDRAGGSVARQAARYALSRQVGRHAVWAAERAATALAVVAFDSRERRSWDAARQAAAAARSAEQRAQAALLRDLFTPFRPAIVAPAWLTWQDRLAVRLARAAYDERHLPAGTLDNERLAVLADALEEAGCEDVQILGHLRSGGDHVRGCWAVDLLLAKR